jgi:uncharacterized membrane protein YdjX (TVP38/TMEM64 family)
MAIRKRSLSKKTNSKKTNSNHTHRKSDSKTNFNGIYKIVGLIVFFIVLYFVSRKTGLKEFLNSGNIERILYSSGAWAPIIFILVYILATVFFFPGTPITILSGFVFGVWLGTFYTIIGAIIGATLAFLVSRFFGRDFVKSMLEDKFKVLNKFSSLLEKNGFLTVVFLRLIPLFPFNGLNYALGLTKVKFRDYFVASLFGMLPGTFMYIFVGDLIRKIGSTDNILQAVLADKNLYIFIFVILIIITIPLLLKKRLKVKT